MVYVVVSDSVVADNTGNGIIATDPILVMVRNSTIAGNGGTGPVALGNSDIAVTRSTIVANSQGWHIGANAFLDSYADNNRDYNSFDTSGAGVVPYK